MMTADIILQERSWWWLWLLAAAAAAVGIVWLYRYERRLVVARVGNTLLALRLTALTLLLVALLRPTLTRVAGPTEKPRVLVAVDVSRSMQTSDPHASEQEKRRWADALEMVDPSSRDLSQTILSEVGQLNRREITGRLLNAGSPSLLNRIRDVADVQLELFAKNALPISDDLDILDDDVAETLDLETTDLIAAMPNAAADERSTALNAIVLFSDGRQTADHDPHSHARELAQAGIVLYPVMLGSPQSPRDISIAGVDAPKSVFLGDTPRFRITLGTHGFEGKELEIQLQPVEGEVLKQTVTVESAQTDALFDWPADTPGRKQFTISVVPQSGELREDNNSAEFAINVVDDTVRVLLIEDEARWEFRFIDNAFRRDPRVDVTQVVFAQPYVGALDETFFEKELDWPADPADWKKSSLAETDLVIVGDVSPDNLTTNRWETLAKFVDEGGGTLVLLAGKQSFAETQLPPVVQDLIPVTELNTFTESGERGKGSPLQRGFHLEPTPEGKQEPMLQFAPTPEENRALWREFPGHNWGMAGAPKPAATGLLKVIPHDELTLPDDSRVVMARHGYGLGQVLWLGIDSTWRWRHRAGDRYHHRFWGQLARWAAHHRSLAADQAVRFEPEESELNVGETALLQARFSRRILERYPQLTAIAEISRVGNHTSLQTAQLKPAANRPLVYEASVPDLPGGEYLARLRVDGADLGDEEFTAPIYVSKSTIQELSDLSADEELLKQLAEITGGRLLRPHELEQLPELLSSTPRAQESAQEVEFGRHPLLLLLFCFCVTGEWIIRKRNGLP